MPKLSILITSIGLRNPLLLIQCQHLKEMIGSRPVEVLVAWDNFETPLGIKRQKLLEAAKGEYVCFVDDDDKLPDYYIDKILPLLDGVDYIGWRQQLYLNGVEMKPTFHSIKYDRHETDEGWYANITHLNPIKRSIALKARFDATPRGTAEDAPWSDQIRPHVKTEHYIEDVMYYYYSSADLSTWDKRHSPTFFPRPELPKKFKYVEL